MSIPSRSDALRDQSPDAAEPPPPGLDVAVANETSFPVDESRLQSAIRAVLTGAGCVSAAVSVAVVDDEMIHELNRQYLDHDYPTDVLSFALAESPTLEGEIVVSVETARRAAKAAGWPAAHELLLYAVHGALHLVGHDDHDPGDASAMRFAERDLLAQLGVEVAAHDPRWSGDAPAESGRHAPRPEAPAR